MTKLTKIDVADVEQLLRKIAFDSNTLTIGDTKQAQALLDKINPPEPTLVEILNKKMGQFGVPDSVRDEWDRMLTLALKQESKIKELEEKVKMHTAASDEYNNIAVKRFDALNKIAYHKPDSMPWYDAYTFIRQTARDALQEKS